MGSGDASSLRTRPSLIGRLKVSDADGWNEFYRVYGKVVRDFAVKAGLTAVEADEVVQETAIGLARHLPGFEYDRKKCRFKTFLLKQARWRILDQFKKRTRAVSLEGGSIASDQTGTSAMDQVRDPREVNLDAMFEAEWREGLCAKAMERIKEKFSLKQFQLFDLLVCKEWKAEDVASSLGMSATNVYVTKHRMTASLEKEIRKLEKEFDRLGALRAGSAG